MLDDNNVLRQRDPSGALRVAAEQYTQAMFDAQVLQGEYEPRELKHVVVAGMGGSALAAGMVKTWLAQEFTIPFEVVRGYELPGYVGPQTLVIASSYSGNTEETLSALAQARKCGAQVAIIASGGQLIDAATEGDIAYVQLPGGIQPRMAMIYNLRALIKLLIHFEVVDKARYDDIAATADWIREQSDSWAADTRVAHNLAKQLALFAVGKTPVIYGGSLMAPIAYKWKISFNENAKNVAFMGELPEFNHNEFMGWTSHPVDKPFAVFDVTSKFEHKRILTRFEISDRLLSGMRPKATTVELQGDTVIAQMIWGCVLADFVSIYTAILNGVDPTPVVLIEKLKKELAK